MTVPSGHAAVSHRAVPPRRAARAAAVLPVVPLEPAIPLVRKRKRMFFSSFTTVHSFRHVLVNRSCSLSVFFVFYIRRRWLLSITWFG